ncbi:hypothetical protein SAMN04515674_112125 [Pseudarcicella hirudinis]|uniref:4-amino-4-deoxy-L-arabinose transferase n=1 Tax=Pseudarcicella hirudinis TaxID=1079859 RepID=A0A1I5WQX3_9BACT|nr:hypothetical protein [Pseudarcicella hirudinis]SFQ22184.1 hypothetical protein SAMN04515674_112125 [Pseudarcicella hirudinis]
MFESAKKESQYLIRAGIFLPILIFIAFLITFSINVPWMDDMDAFPDFLGRFLKADNWDEKWWLLFKPNNEHRIVYAKLMNLWWYFVTGELNMKLIMIFGNITLLGILWLFWRVLKEQNIPLKYFLPIPLLLLHPQYYLISLWSITGHQYQPVIFFGLLGIFLLTRNTITTFIFAVLVIIFDSFTMSNGLFFWFVGIIILLLQGRIRLTGIWVILTILTIKIYFYKFDTEANDLGFAYFMKHPHESFLGFFTTLGGSVDFWNHKAIFVRSIAPTILGMVLVSIGTYWSLGLALYSKELPFSWLKLTRKGKLFELHQRIADKPINLLILGGFLFLAANALVIGILRPRFGYFVMLVSNYKIYPITLLILVYLMLLTGWLRKTSNQKYFYLFLVFSLLFNIASYLKFTPEVIERRKDLLVRAYNQKNNLIGLGAERHSPFREYAITALKRLTDQGIYVYPKSFVADMESQLLAPLPENKVIEANIVKASDGERIENTDLKISGGINDGAYLILKSAQNTYLIYGQQERFFGGKVGFSLLVPTKMLEPADYQIGIMVVSSGKSEIFNTKKQISVNY